MPTYKRAPITPLPRSAPAPAPVAVTAPPPALIPRADGTKTPPISGRSIPETRGGVKTYRVGMETFCAHGNDRAGFVHIVRPDRAVLVAMRARDGNYTEPFATMHPNAEVAEEAAVRWCETGAGHPRPG